MGNGIPHINGVTIMQNIIGQMSNERLFLLADSPSMTGGDNDERNASIVGMISITSTTRQMKKISADGAHPKERNNQVMIDWDAIPIADNSRNPVPGDGNSGSPPSRVQSNRPNA